MVSTDVSTTAASAHGAHHGHDNRLVSSRFAIVPINARMPERLQTKTPGAENPAEKVNEG
jgi:hypothetical protein